MSKDAFHAESFKEGYDIERAGNELLIKSTDYHASPLRLTRKQLEQLGLQFREEHRVDLKAGEEPGEIVDKILRSLDKAIKLMLRQRKKAQWRRDIENLNWAWIILSRLNEEGVQRILEEENS